MCSCVSSAPPPGPQISMLKTGLLSTAKGAVGGQKFASDLTSFGLNIEIGGTGEGCRTMLHVVCYVIYRNTWVYIYLQTFVRHLSGCTIFIISMCLFCDLFSLLWNKRICFLSCGIKGFCFLSCAIKGFVSLLCYKRGHAKLEKCQFTRLVRMFDFVNFFPKWLAN